MHGLCMAEPECKLWSASQALHCLWLEAVSYWGQLYLLVIEKLAKIYITQLLINMKVWPLCNCYCCWLFFLLLLAAENTENVWKFISLPFPKIQSKAVHPAYRCWLTGDSGDWGSVCPLCLRQQLCHLSCSISTPHWSLMNISTPTGPKVSFRLLPQPRAAHQALASAQWLSSLCSA